MVGHNCNKLERSAGRVGLVCSCQRQEYVKGCPQFNGQDFKGLSQRRKSCPAAQPLMTGPGGLPRSARHPNLNKQRIRAKKRKHKGCRAVGLLLGAEAHSLASLPAKQLPWLAARGRERGREDEREGNVALVATTGGAARLYSRLCNLPALQRECRVRGGAPSHPASAQGEPCSLAHLRQSYLISNKQL